MVGLHNEGFEFNEVNWWSNWATVKWVTKSCYAILSDDFDEPFFNRAGFVAPEGSAENTIVRVESIFRRGGREPNFLLQKMRKYSNVARVLRERYEIFDGMSVLQLKTPSFRTNLEVKMEVVDDEKVQEWCETYLLSFYGDKKLLVPVERIAKKAVKKKGVSLLIARYRGSAAGTAAIFRERGLSGVYCIGTKPEFRNLGVATTLLGFVYSNSKRDGSKVILQTISSDDVERLYLRLGFSRVYLKQFFKRSN